MTYAPDDLKAIQRYCHEQTGQPWESLGIIHTTPRGGGYHEGRDLLAAAGRAPGPEYPYSDYSYAEASRDLRGMTDAGSAFDLGGDFTRFREITLGIVAACQRGDPRTADVREVIYTPDGRTVRRWDRLNVRNTGDDSHLGHTHVSWFRDSEGRRARVDNFLGLLVELFEGKDTGMDLTDTVPYASNRSVGTVLSDLYNQEMTGHSGYVATDKSYRTVLLDRVAAAVDELRGRPVAAAVAVDVDELVERLAAKLLPVIVEAIGDDLARRLAG